MHVIKTLRNSSKSSPRLLLLWRFSNGFMGLFFLLATFLQLNDPDPWLWMPIYAICSCFSMCNAVLPFVQEKQFYKYLLSVLLSIYTIILAYLIVSNGHVITSSTHPLSEEIAREIGGLTIVIFWTLTMLLVGVQKVDQLSRFSCLLIFFVVIGPVVASILYYFTTDWEVVPEHCKSIIQRLTRGPANRSKSADN